MLGTTLSTLIISIITFCAAIAGALFVLVSVGKAVDSWRSDKITERQNTIEAIVQLESVECHAPTVLRPVVVRDLFRSQKLPVWAYHREEEDEIDAQTLLGLLQRSLDPYGKWKMKHMLVDAYA
jgi:hypothetical protein